MDRVIVVGILGLLGVSIFLLRRTSLGCILFSCMPELINCLRDEESRKGLQELMSCSDSNAPRIRRQIEELKYLEVPDDVNIAIARVLDEYPTKQLATFSRRVV